MKVLDFVKAFNKPAYLFKNSRLGKWQYFIPICDYDSIVIDNEFDQELPTVIISGNKIVCSIKQLIGKALLEGDTHIFPIPMYYFNRPNLDIVELDSEEPVEVGPATKTAE